MLKEKQLLGKLNFPKYLLKINMSNLLGRHLVGGNGKPKIISNLS